jgi:hypothetical protein
MYNLWEESNLMWPIPSNNLDKITWSFRKTPVISYITRSYVDEAYMSIKLDFLLF